MRVTSIEPVPDHRKARAERALIGALLLDGSSFKRIASIVTDADLVENRHRVVFGAMRSLDANGAPIDSLLVVDELERRGDLDAAGGSDYLAQLVEETPTALNIEAYARLISRGDPAGPEPLFDVHDCGVGDFLDREPAPRIWLLRDLLPLNVVGLLGAGGGTGKSFLSLQLGMAISTARPFLGLDVEDPGSVLMICAEDERDELHRRLWRIVEAMKVAGEFSETDDELLRERLFIASRVGEDNLMTTVIDGQVVRTRICERIALAAEQIPALKLIVLDPVSRFRGGVENANDDGTRFVEAVEALRAATGATILMPHHLNKGALMAGAERLGVESLRGATSLVDGVRWAGAMGTLRKDAATEYGIDPEDANQFVRLDVVKNNYGPPWEGLWLKREMGGVLVPFDMPTKRQRNQERKGEDRYRETLPRLKGLVEQEQEKGVPLTPGRLRDFAGTSGMFAMSDKTLRSILERAIAEGEIKTRPKGRSQELRTW